MKTQKNSVLIDVIGYLVKLVVIWIPFKLPEKYLHVFKDYVGKRTWIEILRDYPIRFSLGYRYGKKLDFYYIQFNKVKLSRLCGYKYGG